DFHGPERGGGVGGEVRVAGSGSEDDDAALLKVPDGTTANVGLADLIHLNGGHHAAVRAALFDRVLHGERVDHGSEHAHVVGGNAVHGTGLLGDSAEEIAAAHHDGDFHAHLGDFGDFASDF